MPAPVDPSAAYALFMGWVTETVTVAAVDRETGDPTATVANVTASRSAPEVAEFAGPESGEGPETRVTWYVRGDQIADDIPGGFHKGDRLTDAAGVVYVVESATAPPGNTLGAGLWVVRTLRATTTGG